MRTSKILSLFLFFLVFIPGSRVYGLSSVTFTEGESIFIDLSLQNLNLVRFPVSGVRVYTGSKALDIKVDEGNVFVKFTGEAPVLPQEVFFIVPSGGVFSMIIVPKEIPAQTILVRMPKEEISEALNWETSHSYIAGLKKLIKAMYEKTPPRGFSIKETEVERSRWQEVKAILKQTYTGITLQGEVYEITNVSKELVRLVEKEFYEKGILAISLERHDLKPGEKTELYLVKKTKAQRELERVIRKSNPLDVLKGDDK